IGGSKLEPVPYRGGAPAINDLIAGHVKLGSLGSTPLIPHYKAGTLRLLAQSTQARSPSLPEVPTYQEAGIKGLVLEQWLGVFVPAGTPPAIVARLNSAINAAPAETAIRPARARPRQRRGILATVPPRFRHLCTPSEGAEHQGRLERPWICVAVDRAKENMMRFFAHAALAAAVLISVGAPARAQQPYPTRPITVVVPFA